MCSFSGVTLQQAINDYLFKNIDKVQAEYKWKISFDKFPVEYEIKDGTDYELAINLRKFIFSKISENHSKSRELQTWYVREWGRVRGNKPETLNGYIDSESADLISLGEGGIATWSKILSVRDPTRYAIFDARVSLSLNLIQISKSISDSIFFPQLPSQNRLVTSAQKQVIKNIGSYVVVGQSIDFYSKYLMLLNEFCLENKKYDIQSCEMVLFAAAIDLAATL